MKVLQLYSKPYNHHDPNSKKILEAQPNDIEGNQLLIHIAMGVKYVDDNKDRRSWLSMIGYLHRIKVVFNDEYNS